MKVEQVLCPQCGCRARSMIAVWKVLVDLIVEDDGIVSPVDPSRLRRLGRPRPESSTVTLVCGGGHHWDTEQVVGGSTSEPRA